MTIADTTDGQRARRSGFAGKQDFPFCYDIRLSNKWGKFKVILLYAADVNTLSDPALFEAARLAVPEERRKKADRYRFDKDKRLCLAAGLLLKAGLRDFGADPDEVPFSNENGKPRLSSGICFNLSHSGDYALCAISDSDIGCDVETVKDFDLKLAARFCPEEYENILSCHGISEQTDMFFRYWVLKESFMKLTGMGLRLPLNSFLIRLSDPISVSREGDCNTYHFAEFTEIPGCRCALCSMEECSRPPLNFISLPDLLSEKI